MAKPDRYELAPLAGPCSGITDPDLHVLMWGDGGETDWGHTARPTPTDQDVLDEARRRGLVPVAGTVERRRGYVGVRVRRHPAAP
jgi:hypothetical protein